MATEWNFAIKHLQEDGEYGLALQLVGLTPARRERLLAKLIKQLATSEKGRLSSSEWEKLDELMVKLCGAYFASLFDRYCDQNPETWRNRDQGPAYDQVGRHARDLVDLIPSSGQGYIREVDMADVNLRPWAVRIFPKTRRMLLDRLASAWSQASTEEVALAFFACLYEHLSNEFDGEEIATHLRAHDKNASRQRIEYVFSGYEFQGSYKAEKVGETLRIAWVRTFRSHGEFAQRILTPEEIHD